MRQYFQKHKWHLVIFIILLLIAGMSWHFSSIETPKLEDIKTPTTTDFTATTPITSYKPSTRAQTEGLPVTSYQLLVTTTSTAYDAMKNSQLDFKTKTFAGLGEFVEEIGGLKNDPPNGRYWGYFINGENAKLGISTQIVVPSDLIEWKYGNANF